MKEWQTNLIGAVIITIIGIGLIAGGMSVQIPSQYKTFLGIPYAVNPEFAIAFYQMMLLLMLGIFMAGIGIGILANTYTIYRLEKKLGSQKTL